MSPVLPPQGSGFHPEQGTKIPMLQSQKKKSLRTRKKILIAYYEITYTTKTGFSVLQEEESLKYNRLQFLKKQN